MNDVDRAWLAGLLEGEGYFGTNCSGRSRRPSLRVVLEMNDLDVIQRAAGLTGATVTTKSAPSMNGRTTWYVGWRGQQAEDLMRAVRPWMMARRGARIDALLEMDLGHHPRQLAAA